MNFLNWSFGVFENGELSFGLITDNQELLDLPPKEISIENFKQEIKDQHE